ARREHVLDIDEFEAAVVVLDEGAGALDPVAAVGVDRGVEAEAGLMDVAANDAVEAAALRFLEEGLLVVGDEGAGALDLEFHCAGEGPLGTAEELPAGVDHAVEEQEMAVGPGAEEREEPRVLDDEVVLIAVGDEEAAAVGGAVLGLEDELHAAEVDAGVLAE